MGSESDQLLFGLTQPLASLDPHLGRAVMEARPDPAAAVKRFPSGMQSVYEGQRKYDPAIDDAMLIGGTRVMYMMEALATDFAAAFNEAENRFLKDSDATNPNRAPKECWPSGQEFRNILFKAGQHQGLEAEKYLHRIPDKELRLFAQIELCAAVAALPQIGGSTVWPPSA